MHVKILHPVHIWIFSIDSQISFWAVYPDWDPIQKQAVHLLLCVWIPFNLAQVWYWWRVINAKYCSWQSLTFHLLKSKKFGWLSPTLHLAIRIWMVASKRGMEAGHWLLTAVAQNWYTLKVFWPELTPWFQTNSKGIWKISGSTWKCTEHVPAIHSSLVKLLTLACWRGSGAILWVVTALNFSGCFFSSWCNLGCSISYIFYKLVVRYKNLRINGRHLYLDKW